MKLSRHLWLLLGLLSLLLGIIGIILPVLPTTPFVILAAFAFSKSSPRLHNWLVNHKTFGPMISDWSEHGAIASKYKVMALSMMAGVFTLSLIMEVSSTILIIQAVCLSGAAVFILTRPSGPKRQ